MQLSNSVKYITVIFFLITLIFLCIPIVQAGQLEIRITNIKNQDIIKINEKEHFIVSVYDPSLTDTPYLINVTIVFNELPYMINGESAELILQAPEVDSDRSYQIYALKEGYTSTNKTIEILNNDSKNLVIITEDVVDAGNHFPVYIKDENGNPISNVLVGIENYWDQRASTDDNGRVLLTAPNDKEEITILAQKDPYTRVKHTIKVNIESPWWETFKNSPFFPIVFGLIILLFVVIYVNQKQKKDIFNRASEISKEKKKNNSVEDGNYKTPSESKEEIIDYKVGPKDTVRSQSKTDSKIEEIRITRPKKEKEVIPVKSDIDKTERIISENKIKKDKYEWFEGTDSVRYEIDKITGEIDEEGKDKWFEGIDNIKEKINEKVKNKDKKKDNKK